MKKPESERRFRGRLTRWTMALVAVAITVGLGSSLTETVSAQGLQSGEDVLLNNEVPREVENVTVDQKLGGLIPLNLPLIESTGRRVKTGDFIGPEKPTIITLNYSTCPMLCSVQLNNLTKSLEQLDLRIGEDFQILTVSIDPNESSETARETKQKYIDLLSRKQPGAEQGWAFCTARQPIIAKLTDALGFRYTYDPKTGEYYHPAMLAFISPEGVITRYSLDVGFEPGDLRKALIEAGEGSVGSAVDQFVLWCFSYDPASNSYVPQAWKIMRLGGAATVIIVLICLVPYWVGRKRMPLELSDTELDASMDPASKQLRIKRPETTA